MVKYKDLKTSILTYFTLTFIFIKMIGHTKSECILLSIKLPRDFFSLLADLFYYLFEAKFIQRLIHKKNARCSL